jgi:integrase
MARRRVHGPYKHGNKWRIVLVGEDGTQAVESFGSKDEAEAEKRRNEDEVERYEGITVAQAIDKYEVYQRGKGNKPRSIQTTRGRITRLLADVATRPLQSIRDNSAFRVYAKLQTQVSTDYHRNALNETRTFFNWCMARPQKWIKSNPFKEVKGEGKRKKGKPQHRIDESRKFEARCFELIAAGDIAGAVSLSALYFGTRITELVSRPVRDLDDDGWLLWIPDSKTEAGRRTLEVPDSLRVVLQQLAAGRQPDEPLFKGPRKGQAITRYTAYDMVKRVCREAGVPEVSPHGLRGTHSSLARERGATPKMVAAALGHTSYDAVTAKNYVAPGTDQRVQQRTVLSVLAGGKRGN